jgi:hypothetical protein
LKLIIASLVVLLLVILFLFALFPSEISVSRIIQIKSSMSQVREKIADLREWENWNELLAAHTAGRITKSQPDRIDSNYISLDGDSVELLKAGKDTVTTRWQHGRKSFTGNFILTEMNGMVALEWTLHFHVNWYPWNKLASMFYEKQLGPEMENSLVNLQKELEAPAN